MKCELRATSQQNFLTESVHICDIYQTLFRKIMVRDAINHRIVVQIRQFISFFSLSLLATQLKHETLIDIRHYLMSTSIANQPFGSVAIDE